MSELENLRGLAWAVREYFTLRGNEDARILVETFAKIELDIRKCLAVQEVYGWHSPDNDEQGGGE